MKLELLVAIVGAFGTLALTINAFFLRGIFIDLNDVKIKLAQISARSESKEARLQNLERNEREFFDRLNIVEREVLK